MTGSGVRVPLAAPLPIRQRSPPSAFTIQHTESATFSLSATVPVRSGSLTAGKIVGLFVGLGPMRFAKGQHFGWGMARGKLTDATIKNAKPSERLVKLSDGGGLQLWLTPGGGKLWNFA